MAKRERATINTGIWGDGDWKSLHFTCQWLYEALLTRSDLNHVGVADWRPRKLYKSARGLSLDLIEKAAEELQQARFILIDHDTEEVLIRSFLKHDGVLRNPNLGALVKSAYDSVGSPEIQKVIIHELKKRSESDPQPPVFTSEKSKRYMDEMLELHSAPIDEFLNGVQHPSTTALGTASTTAFKKGDPSTTSTYTPSNEGGVGETSRRKPEVPLPPDFTPTPSHEAKAKELGVSLQWELEKFENHHRARDTRFRDWNQALHGWIKRAAEYSTGKPGPPQPQSTFDPWAKDWSEEDFRKNT